MTAKTAFSDDDWARVRRAPAVAGMSISLADPGGPIELTKETMATLRSIGSPPSDQELLVAVSQEIMAMSQRRENPMGGFKVEDAKRAGEQVLQELREVQAIVRTTATPEEADAFAGWMLAVARDAADAAKEGGFMGIGAEQVSAGEARMLDELRSALGAPG
jgi:hypothetical protein